MAIGMMAKVMAKDFSSLLTVIYMMEIGSPVKDLAREYSLKLIKTFITENG